MKKVFLIICIFCFLCLPTMADRGTVKVTLPTFKVTINGQQMDNTYNQFPLLVYKGITYFPMAYDYAGFLGTKVNWYQQSRSYNNKSVLFIGVAPEKMEVLNLITTPTANQNSYYATIADYGIALNTTNANDFLDNSKEVYPILTFRDITYFPLTWRFAVEQFGWDYAFDCESGLKIDSASSFRPVIDDRRIGATLPEATWTDYYYGENYYIGYPKTTFDNNYKLIIRQRGGQEKEYSLKGQLQGDYYFNKVKLASGGYVDGKPSITGDVFAVLCKKIDNSGEHNVLLKINLTTGQIISEEISKSLFFQYCMPT